MFDKQYRFRGRHAERVDLLTNQFDESGKLKLFDRNVDIYVNAPIIGFLYGRKADLDTSIDKATNVMGDRVIYSSEDLKFNFKLIMLLDKNYEPDKQKRIDKAFRALGPEQSAEDEALFDSYVRGGIDVLYEKLLEGASSTDDYISKLYDFLEEFYERFNKEILKDDILALCKSPNN